MYEYFSVKHQLLYPNDLFKRNPLIDVLLFY